MNITMSHTYRNYHGLPWYFDTRYPSGAYHPGEYSDASLGGSDMGFQVAL